MKGTCTRVWITLAPVTLLAACTLGSGIDEPEVPDDFYAGAMATFEVEGETFKAWITDDEAIHHFNNLLDGTSAETIPIGPLREGSGFENHNIPWSWHLDPEATVLTDDADEECSALPSVVEANLAAWLVTGIYCPLNAELTNLELVRPR